MSNPQNRQVFDIGMFAVAMRHVAQAQAAHAQQQAMAAGAARPIVAPGAPAPGMVPGPAPVLAPAAAYQRPPDIVTAPAPASAYAPQIAPEEAAAYGRLFQGLRPTPAGLVSGPAPAPALFFFEDRSGPLTYARLVGGVRRGGTGRDGTGGARIAVESAWTIMAKSKLPAESIGRIVYVCRLVPHPPARVC